MTSIPATRSSGRHAVGAAVPPVVSAASPRRRTQRTAWNLAAVTIIWLTSLFVAALWVAGGNLQLAMGGAADALESHGRLTGLVASNLLLYQVLLMARIPVFEKGFGRDGITRVHRTVGFWSFWLMVAHIVLITAGYAVATQVDPLAQLWDLIVNYPAMLLATVGTVLLILVVVLSVRAARRRLRYESWHLIHLYAYVGVFLALPHQLWTGADFLSSPAATTYWWALWAAAAASVLIWRVAVPLISSARHQIRVESVTSDGANGVLVRMHGRRVRKLRAKAGQFFVWRFRDGKGWSAGHPFSLAAAPAGDHLAISASIVGDGTSRLTRMRPGTRVLIEGPYGRMTGDARRGTKLLMLAAGAGVAPLVSILESEPYAPGGATLITRNSTPRDALRSDAIAVLNSRRGLTHFALDGPRTTGASPWLPATHAAWRGEDLIRYVAPDIENYDVYVCGPGPWMDAVIRDLHALGVPNRRIHSESFTI